MDAKEMIQRIGKILIWILIAAWFVVMMGFVSGEADKVICNHIEVVLSDSLNSSFITKADIRSIMDATGLQLQGYSLAEINTRELEEELEKNSYVKNAEVSKDISGRLYVSIDQRIPLVRILPDGKRGYYLDREGVVLPLSDRFTPLIILASGNIPYPGKDGKPVKQLEELHQFASYLADNEFWRDQVVQIYVNREGEYELIPRVGAHQILLGDMDRWQKKLRNLELLYKQGFSRYGWNSYGTINLKYTNQVICTKR